MFVLHIYPQDSHSIIWGRISRSGLIAKLRMIWAGGEKKAWL